MKFFRVQQPLRHPDDPVIPIASDPPPAPSPHNRQLACEFCESTLAQSGQVMIVGKRAKRMRDLEDEVEAREKTIAERDAEITKLKQENADLRAKLPTKKSAW